MRKNENEKEEEEEEEEKHENHTCWNFKGQLNSMKSLGQWTSWLYREPVRYAMLSCTGGYQGHEKFSSLPSARASLTCSKT